MEYIFGFAVATTLSEMFLSFYKEIMDVQCFLFYISLLNYARI